MTTMTKERPILFSGPMVRAILDGRKTQTRRVMKPQPTHRIIEGRVGLTIGMDPALDGKAWYDADCINPGRLVACPFGGIGDRLWVRESIRFVGATAVGDLSEYEADGALTKADGWPWQRNRLPSIHCPRGLSRLTLEITDIRVQRLTEISDRDAKAEGVWAPSSDADPDAVERMYDPRDEFRHLWDSLNADRGFGWDVNPWVWALTFRRVEAA